jgi:hypothetical protein
VTQEQQRDGEAHAKQRRVDRTFTIDGSREREIEIENRNIDRTKSRTRRETESDNRTG